MNETPIIMSGNMVKAILDGTKTMTRRVVTPGTSIVGEGKVDWSNFDWEQKTEYDFGDSRYSTESEFIPDELKGELIGVQKAPLPFVDGDLERYHYQYLHVPYRWEDDAKIYRIYPKWDVGDRLWVKETFVLENDAEYQYEDYYHLATDRPIKTIPPEGEFSGYHLIPHYKATEPEPMICDDGEYTRWKPSIFMPRWASRITLEITEVRVERVQEISNADCKAEGTNYNKPWGFSDGYVNSFAWLWDSLNAKRGYGWEVNPWVWVISFKV